MQLTSRFWRYAAACALLGLVLGIRYALAPMLRDGIPYLFYLPVILLAAWVGKLGPALLVLVFGFALDDLLFTPPLYQFHSYSPVELTLVILYFLSGGIGIAVINNYHRAKEKLRIREAQQKELERQIAERENAQAELARQKERFELLSEAAAHLLMTEEPSAVLGNIFQKLSPYADVDLYLVFLLDKSGESFHLSASTGVPREITAQLTALSFDQMLCGSEMSQKKPLVIKDLQCCENPKAILMRSLRVRAYACYPLLPNSNLLGTVAFGSLHKEEFSKEDLDLFHTVCRYVSIALDRLRLLNEARDRSAQLQAAQQQLQGYAAQLEHRVAERTANLAQSLNSLEGVLYHVAHDLRAPLRAIHGLTQILLDHCGGQVDATAEETAQRLKAAAKKMDILIHDLLAYGRLGHQEIALVWVDLNGLVDKVREHFEKEIRAKHAVVEVERPLPRVWADPEVLKPILESLFSNALKFVSPGTVPRIRLYAKGEPQEICLFIEDNGIGIALEYQERIFGVFERLYPEEEYPGTGIGLAIVKKGMERLGGKATVQSQPGQGSRFCLEFKPIEPFP